MDQSPVNRNHAFTLIELSIVMVIVALIIGGILKGQDLIHAANARSILSQIQKYTSAVNVFQSKYTAMPGDFNRAKSFIVGAAQNGDGDGLIRNYPYQIPGNPNWALWLSSGWFSMGGNAYEPTAFWQNLSATGLIEGSYATVAVGGNPEYPGINFPMIANNNNHLGIYVYGSKVTYKNYFHLGIGDMYTAASGFQYISGNCLSPMEAQYIDSKIDDGLATNGTIVVRGTTLGPEYTSTYTNVANLDINQVNQCALGPSGNNPGNYGYNTVAPASSALCQLRIELGN
jgi:prepilin-type N-terminal cleavage/methylation domain-containing protein